MFFNEVQEFPIEQIERFPKGYNEGKYYILVDRFKILFTKKFISKLE